MPRASVGAGPVRVGGGCCLAVVGVVVVLAVLVFALTGSAIAATPSARSAQKATYNEINNETSVGEGITSEEKSEIHCGRLTNARYHCSFHFLTPLCSLRGYARWDHGYSYVTFRKYGVEVNLHLTQAECSRS